MECLRLVRKEDVELLFEWANDPVVRQNAFSTEPISYENHVHWFQNKLQDEDCRIYIFMKEDCAIGQIRLDGITEEKTGIDYSIASEFRGQGFGRKMLQLLEEKIRQDLPKVQVLMAEVKRENHASKQVFLKNDFQEAYTVYEKFLGK